MFFNFSSTVHFLFHHGTTVFYFLFYCIFLILSSAAFKMCSVTCLVHSSMLPVSITKRLVFSQLVLNNYHLALLKHHLGNVNYFCLDISTFNIILIGKWSLPIVLSPSHSIHMNSLKCLKLMLHLCMKLYLLFKLIPISWPLFKQTKELSSMISSFIFASIFCLVATPKIVMSIEITTPHSHFSPISFI